MHATELGDEARHVVGFAGRHATAADDEIAARRCVEQCIAQYGRVVAQVLHGSWLDAERAQHATEAVAIAVVDLAVAERLPRRYQFIARHEQRDTRDARDRDARVAAGGEDTEARRRQRIARAQRVLARANVLPCRPHVRACAFTRADDDCTAIDAHVLLDDHGVGIPRQRCAGRDAHALAGSEARLLGRACEHLRGNAETAFAHARQFGAAQCVAVHRRIREWRLVVRRDEIAGEDAPERLLEHDVFGSTRALCT